MFYMYFSILNYRRNDILKNKLNLNIRIFILLSLILSVVFTAIICAITIKMCTKKDIIDIASTSTVSSKDVIANEYIENEIDNDIVYIESLPQNEKVIKEENTQSTNLPTGKSKYYIKVNYSANVVNIYTKDKNGNYTVPYKAMVCSCGTATPQAGTYEISSKYRWLSLIGNVNGQYSTRIVNHILFHSVPYLTKSHDSLEYWEYDKLGTTASAGCIRLTVEDAKWIYDNCKSGTKVEFYSDVNPGPLGKPTATKISSNEACRNWDPTDSNENNPWNK